MSRTSTAIWQDVEHVIGVDHFCILGESDLELHDSSWRTTNMYYRNMLTHSSYMNYTKVTQLLLTRSMYLSMNCLLMWRQPIESCSTMEGAFFVQWQWRRGLILATLALALSTAKTHGERHNCHRWWLRCMSRRNNSPYGAQDLVGGFGGERLGNWFAGRGGPLTTNAPCGFVMVMKLRWKVTRVVWGGF